MVNQQRELQECVTFDSDGWLSSGDELITDG